MKTSLLTLLETKKGQKINEAFGPIIIPMLTKMQFLVDEFGFENPKIDMGRHECWFNLKKENINVHIEYELFNYPYGRLSVVKNSATKEYSLDELSPMSTTELEAKPPIQVDQIEKRLDDFASSIRRKLIEESKTNKS